MSKFTELVNELASHILSIDQERLQDDAFDVISEFIKRFLAKGVSESKYTSISEYLELPTESLRKLVICLFHILFGVVHGGAKTFPTFKSALEQSIMEPDHCDKLYNIVTELSSLNDVEELLKSVLDHDSRGKYKTSSWRMDIDIAQRSSNNLDPEVSFSWKIETADGESISLMVSPAMLLKLNEELQKATLDMRRTKNLPK